ncbi:alpha/beta-hydrolase [Pyrenochaeta sp. DS3sAY3a]|nr:alpha/beta-hydrolase [Pyrenochaeta sp. DS3sAY3a]
MNPFKNAEPLAFHPQSITTHIFSLILRTMLLPLLLSTLLPLTASTPHPPLLPRQTPSGPCKDHHIFMARGAGDPYPGTLGGLPALVCKGVASCDYEDILYVGTFDKVCASVDVGVVNATMQIRSYGARCPGAKLAVLGHSEGAAVMGNVLGGGSTSFSGCTMKTTGANTPASVAFSQILAVALTGDMRHTASQAYNVGTGKAKNGIWPRSTAELTGLNAWSAKLRTWCEDSDPVCANGSNVQTHGAYFTRFGQEIADWMRGMLGIGA